MTRIGRIAALALVYVAAVGMAVGGAEAYLRVHGLGDRCRSGMPEHPGPPAAWARPEPVLGWITDRGYDPGINPQGFRDPRDFAAVDLASSDPRVMMLGDSFVWGAEGAAEATIPRRLEGALGSGWSVFNVSAPGWGIDQMYLAYRAYRDVLRPRVVVLAYIDDDVARVIEPFRFNENVAKPVFRLAGDGVELVRTPPPVRETGLASSVIFRCAAREVRRRTLGPTISRRLLAQLVADTAARGERLVLVRIAEQNGLTPRWRVPWRRAHRFAELVSADAWVDTTDAFVAAAAAGRALYEPLGHLTDEGKRIVTELVAPRVAPRAPRG